jgi:hypothetical protein
VGRATPLLALVDRGRLFMRRTTAPRADGLELVDGRFWPPRPGVCNFSPSFRFDPSLFKHGSPCPIGHSRAGPGAGAVFPVFGAPEVKLGCQPISLATKPKMVRSPLHRFMEYCLAYETVHAPGFREVRSIMLLTGFMAKRPLVGVSSGSVPYPLAG